MLRVELSDQEAEYLDDILGMWLEGIEEELPRIREADNDSHWSTFSLRKQRESAQRIRMRIQLERRDADDDGRTTRSV